MTEVVDNTSATEPVDASAADPDPQAVDKEEGTEPTSTPDSEPSDSGALNSTQQATVRRLMEQRDQQWQQWHQGQRNAQANAGAQSAAAAAEVDEMTQELRGLYTDDEVGQKTIEKHLKKRLAAGGQGPNASQVAQIARQEADKVRNQVQSGVAVTNEVRALVSEGVISTQSEQRIVEAEYTNRLSDPSMAQAASTPIGAEMILKGVVYDLIKTKKIKPGAKPKPPANPLTSGGNGSPSPVASKEALDPRKSPFASVRAMSEADVRAAADTSRGNFAGAANG